MKKYQIYIVSLVVFLLSYGQQTYACGGWYHPYEPYDLKMFRMYNPPSNSGKSKLVNCELWQSQTSSRIPIDDIMEVLYFWDIDKLENPRKWKSDVLPSNLFADWIVKDAHHWEYEYVLISKTIEKLRNDMLDPWFYWYDEDAVVKSLRDCIKDLEYFMSDNPSQVDWLTQRAELQMARAYFAIKDYNALEEKWTAYWHSGPEGYIKDQIAGYVAGAYLRTGNADIAREMYGRLGDAESLLYCLKYEGKACASGVEKLEYLYQYSPDCIALKKLLQYYVDNGWNSKSNSQDKTMDDMTQFVEKVVREKRCKDMAPWYYSAAFFALDRDDYPAVKKYIADARRCGPDEYLSQSIRVLEMFADAKYMSLGSDYEEKLLAGIKYLTRWIESEDVKELGTSYVGWDNIYNISGFYPYDMLKKIIQGVVCPRYISAGKVPDALSLAYYSDNILAKSVEKKENYGFLRELKHARWRTYTFFLLDTQPVKYDIAFLYENFENADAPLYRYMRYKAAPDPDYIYDIIGTRYLRAMNYVQAKRFLSNVSSGYENSLNTLSWLKNCNPMPWLGNKFWSEGLVRRKLYFATKMCELEVLMKGKSDKGAAALAKLQYAMGMHASFNDSWALTRYSDSAGEDFRWIGYTDYTDWANYPDDVPEHNIKYPRKAQEIVSRLKQEAFSSLPNANSRALRHYAIYPGLYQGRADIQSIASSYSEYRTLCDGIDDYRKAQKHN